MAVLSLPLTFTNSFWSQDYRKGLQVLFHKLEQGAAENDEIVNFVRARAAAEAQLAATLINPLDAGASGTGFDADDGASLLMAFRGLQAEAVTQGAAHKATASELSTLVADPFDEWAQGYRARLDQTKIAVLDNWLKAYEGAQGDVAKLKQQYLSKTRRADEAEDDAKFAPNSGGVDNYTTSPKMRPADRRTPPLRTASVSERIASRLKEIQKRSANAIAVATANQPEVVTHVDELDPPEIKLDKGKGKAVESPERMDSPPPMSPPLPPAKMATLTIPEAPAPILLAGLAFPPSSLSQLLTRAAAELDLRPVRFPLLGEYPDCFTGEEFVTWLNEHVPGFGGSLDRAEDAAKELTERDGLLRRIGEFGNQFEHSDEAFYQFRPKAFSPDLKTTDSAVSPIVKPENIIKRTNNFVNLVSRALNAGPNGEPAYLKLRHEAEQADDVYRLAVRKLDRQRLGLEERLEDTLKTLQRWETERLRAVKTVLLQYQGTISNIPKSYEASIERSSTLLSAYQPESDLTALIERYRTGPFRPDAQVYESVAHDESDVLFGIDLRKWAEGGWSTLPAGGDDSQTIPPVVTALLNGITAAYGKLPDNAEKRKAWIYDVPLPAVHHLRETLNGADALSPELFVAYDVPVIASTLKLWLLELDPPIVLYEGWDEFRKLYPTVGSSVKKDGEVTEEQRIKDLGMALQKLPKVHLFVLDAVVSHLKKLIGDTPVEEDPEVYITKLALSIGRTILRPKIETGVSVQDRHPTLLFIDLLKNYDAILPPTITRKKRESERKVPIRKRTAAVDMRISRSRIPVDADHKQLLAAQHAALSPPKASSRFNDIPPPPPPVPGPPPALAAVVNTPPPPPVLPAAVVDAPLVPPPPPPPIHDEPEEIAAPPRFKSPPPEADDLPPRPTFKAPPPEDEDLPPRPSFKPPPPEVDDEPPRPKFVEPPPPPPLDNGPASPALSSASPTTEAARVTRTGSGASSVGVRGPRISKGPRGPGTVSSMVSNLNKSGSSSPRSGSPTSPNYKRMSASPVRRPSSVLNRTSASFSRRTMASDAEDNVVDK